MHAVHDDVDANILRLWLAIGLPDIADMQISPEQICTRHWNGDQIAPVNGDAWTLRWGGFAFVFFVPPAKARIPQGKRLQSRRLAGVILANEDDRLAQFDVGVGETFEVFDS